jgi:hypothetical protein
MQIESKAVSIRPSDALPDICYVASVGLPSPAIVGVSAPNTDSLGVTSYTKSPDEGDATTLPVTLPNSTRNEDEPDEEDGAYESAYQAAQLSPKMRRLTDLAIVTELVTGSPVEVIAKTYRVDVNYVSRIRGEWLKACRLQEAFDYRHDLKLLALEAIRDGLKAKSDPFKRMGGGIRVMQGIGEFKPDVTNIAVLQRIENVPAELRSRFITSSVQDEQKAIEAEVVTHDENT